MKDLLHVADEMRLELASLAHAISELNTLVELLGAIPHDSIIEYARTMLEDTITMLDGTYEKLQEFLTDLEESCLSERRPTRRLAGRGGGTAARLILFISGDLPWPTPRG